jgi:hypothetical protein
MLRVRSKLRELFSGEKLLFSNGGGEGQATEVSII